MCGIFGYFCRSQVSMQRVLELLQILEVHKYTDLGETRCVGGHGAGVCFLENAGNISVYKVGKTNSSPAKDLLLIKDIIEVESRIVLGHVRYASSDLMDTIKYAEAAQPYKVNCLGLSEIASAHNGKVENYLNIRKDLSEDHHFQSETVKLVDSEVIPHLFEESLRLHNDEIEARKHVSERLEGNNTIALLSMTKNLSLLHVIHKGQTRGMHVWKNDRGEIILCSREEPLQQVFKDFLEEGNFEKVLSIKWKEDKEVQQTYKIVEPLERIKI